MIMSGNALDPRDRCVGDHCSGADEPIAVLIFLMSLATEGRTRLRTVSVDRRLTDPLTGRT